MEYERWLGYIVNVFLPIVDSENGFTVPIPLHDSAFDLAVRQLSVIVLICPSLMISSIKHLSIYLLAICMSLDKCLFKFFLI